MYSRTSSKIKSRTDVKLVSNSKKQSFYYILIATNSKRFYILILKIYIGPSHNRIGEEIVKINRVHIQQFETKPRFKVNFAHDTSLQNWTQYITVRFHQFLLRIQLNYKR
jgi:hypothetical protein